MRIKFEEYREFNAGGGYMFTNESIVVAAELAKKAAPKRVGGICSSGDLLFAAFAPVADECVMVDHSLMSLQVAAVKGILIEHLTGTELKKLLQEVGCDAYKTQRESKSRLQDAIHEATQELPDPLRHVANYYGDPHVISASSWANVWSPVTAETIDAAREKLDHIKIIHGDLRDLKEPVDLLYLSNALEHNGFDGVHPDVKALTPLVKDSGSIFLTSAGNTYLNKLVAMNMEIVHNNKAETLEKRHMEEMASWSYQLLSKKAPQVEAVKVTT